VKVDETDIVTLQLGQQAEISIDAMSGQTFTGKVVEIGDTAILRSTGAAASDSAVSSQEAKDFKVVVALDSPPANIKPGLSCTARITTAVRHAVLVVPLQALTVKQADAAAGSPAPGSPAPSSPAPSASTKPRTERITGVFVLRQGKAEFQRVHTGISGTLEVEAVDGIAENDEIVVGPYQLIRTLRSGTPVTVDKAPAVPSQPGA
jgi:HlyD family secretion protein